MQRLSALASVDAAARLEFLHRLFQLTATIAILDRTKMNPRISLSDLLARLESADHTIAYFNKPLPEILLSTDCVSWADGAAVAASIWSSNRLTMFPIQKIEGGEEAGSGFLFLRIRSQIGVIYAVAAGDALFRFSSAATACSTTVPLKGRAWQKGACDF
jgi:hypothetical protein